MRECRGWYYLVWRAGYYRCFFIWSFTNKQTKKQRNKQNINKGNNAVNQLIPTIDGENRKKSGNCITPKYQNVCNLADAARCVSYFFLKFIWLKKKKKKKKERNTPLSFIKRDFIDLMWQTRAGHNPPISFIYGTAVRYRRDSSLS